LNTNIFKTKYNKIYSKKKKTENESHNSLKSWQEFFKAYTIASKNSVYHKFLFLIDEDIDLESLCYLKILEILSKSNNNISKNLSSITCVSIDKCNNDKINYKTPSIKDKIIDIEKEITNCFIFSAQVKIECTLLNLKLRSKFINHNNFNTYSFGLNYTPNYKINFINLSINNLFIFMQGKNKFLSQKSISTVNTLYLWGESFVRRLSLRNYNIFKELLKLISPTSINFDIKKKSNTSSLDFLNIHSITKKQVKESDFFFFFNIEDSFLSRYISTHSVKNSYWINYNKIFYFKKDVKKEITSIPVLSHYEYPSIFLNLENRPQNTLKFSNKETFNKSLKCLSYKLLSILNSSKQYYIKIYQKCFLNNLYLYISFEIISIKKLEETKFIFDILKNFINFSNTSMYFKLFTINFKKNIYLKSFSYPFKKIYKDFYVMNTLTKNSLNMTQYSRVNKKLNLF
jgi:hypothetical protein